MMPNKDGIALCETLKQDPRTSHIPIILLTAKSGNSNELNGLKNKADDYIMKPFNAEIVKQKVINLILSRKELQKKYSQYVYLYPKDIAVTNIDEEFLENVQKVIDSKLMKADFSAKDFSRELALSRMQLHRKLKALTGLSTTEFIRSQRLKTAVKLLETSDFTVSEIAYTVGFNTPSYFTKCFKEAYLCNPSDYIKK
jgi:AraC-like DNA-binding protein